MHKYDSGQYHVLLFDARQRKRSTLLVRNFTAGQAAADRWERRTGGSAVVMRCLFNTQQRRRIW